MAGEDNSWAELRTVGHFAPVRVDLKKGAAVPGVGSTHFPAPGLEVGDAGQRVVEHRGVERDGAGVGKGGKLVT